MQVKKRLSEKEHSLALRSQLKKMMEHKKISKQVQIATLKNRQQEKKKFISSVQKHIKGTIYIKRAVVIYKRQNVQIY